MTILSNEPARTAWACLEQSLRQRRPVIVTYHERRRLICPHALGWKNHRPMLLAYQADGLTSTASAAPCKRWRCMFIDEIDCVIAADPTTPWRTADNYSPTRPFNAIDHVAVALGRHDMPREVSSLEFSRSEFDPTSG